MFSNASNFVQGVDSAFFIITGISVFFLVTLTATMIFFVVKYNKKKGKPAIQIKDNSLLEITWITIPMILVLYMFYIGWQGFLPMRQAPKDAMQVKAIGSMWKWTFEYAGNKQSDTLVLPINKAVKVNLASTDVLHGFFIPAFRIKEDVVPKKNNYSWFIPGQLGDFDLFCTVYCGVSHSYMSAIVRIVNQQDYDKWITALPVKKANTNSGHAVLEKMVALPVTLLMVQNLLVRLLKDCRDRKLMLRPMEHPERLLLMMLILRHLFMNQTRMWWSGIHKD